MGDAYEPVGGRLRSMVLGLDLVREGEMLRLYDATTDERLPTRAERAEPQQRRAEQADTRNQQLLREIEELRRRLQDGER